MTVLKGPATNLLPVATLTTTSGGTFIWSAPATVTPNKDYALKLVDSVTYNFGGFMTLVAAPTTSTTSTTSTTPASAPAYTSSSMPSVTSSATPSTITPSTTPVTVSPSTTGPLVIAPGPAVNTSSMITATPASGQASALPLIVTLNGTTTTVFDCSCTDKPWANSTMAPIGTAPTPSAGFTTPLAGNSTLWAMTLSATSTPMTTAPSASATYTVAPTNAASSYGVSWAALAMGAIAVPFFML